MTPPVEDQIGEAVECWNCAGEGFVSSCFEEFACVDPESGCDDCTRYCDICGGRGGWRNTIKISRGSIARGLPALNAEPGHDR